MKVRLQKSGECPTLAFGFDPAGDRDHHTPLGKHGKAGCVTYQHVESHTRISEVEFASDRSWRAGQGRAKSTANSLCLCFGSAVYPPGDLSMHLTMPLFVHL